MQRFSFFNNLCKQDLQKKMFPVARVGQLLNLPSYYSKWNSSTASYHLLFVLSLLRVNMNVKEKKTESNNNKLMQIMSLQEIFRCK